MTTLFTLLIAITLPTGLIERALDFFERGDYRTSAELLDEAAAVDLEEFQLNNLHYLRGRIALEEEDWSRAESEFAQVSESSVLGDLALWHRGRVALRDSRSGDILRFLTLLGPGFPDALRLELADGAPEDVALAIYRSVSGRRSQWKRASILDDEDAMWQLLARSRGDEFALQAARRLDGRPATPVQSLRLAKTFHTHRIFDRAEAIYSTLLEDRSAIGAQAHYELGRTYFQRLRYEDAIAVYRATIERFPDTDWEREADEQIPPNYWRSLDYPGAIAAYEALIDKYDDDPDLYQSALRDMIDIHRAMGEVDQAQRLIDQAMAGGPDRRDRAVLTFTRAKIQYGEGQYEEALGSFRQLRGMRTGRAANGTDQTEVRFFEASSLEALGRVDEARAIWTELSEEPFSYYGLRSTGKLRPSSAPSVTLQQVVSRTMDTPAASLCGETSDVDFVDVVRQRRLSRTRGFLKPGSVETDLVGELVFLRQWDEAFYWANRVASRWRDQALADLAYLASDFRRSMLYADRLRPVADMQLFSLDAEYSPETRVLMDMLYPTAFRDIVCREAEASDVNPLWLHAIMWQESRYNPEALSSASARGLMQFIPETATRIANEVGLTDFMLDDLYRPEISIRLGARYWAELIEVFGSPELALAAYNGGERNVARWRAKSELEDTESFVSDIGFIQTKAYVREVFGLFAKYAHLL